MLTENISCNFIKSALCMLLVLLLLLVPDLLHAQETGVIEGQIIIGRDGALPLPLFPSSTLPQTAPKLYPTPRTVLI